MNNRDFKGIWIPKELWFNKNLSVIDKVLLAEIDSLDNENHCTASNEYFAEFFDVGVATITRSIKKLKDKGLIETKMVTSDTGSYRVIKMIRGSNQNDETGLIKMISNYNSDNKTNEILSKDNISRQQEPVPFDFGIADKPIKQNLYQKCSGMIVDRYPNYPKVMNLLHEYLDLRLDIAKQDGKTFYVNQWKGILDDLDNVHKQGFGLDPIIRQSITRGYRSFFPPTSQNTKQSNPDSNKAEQHKFNKDIDKLATNEDGTPMTF